MSPKCLVFLVPLALLLVSRPASAEAAEETRGSLVVSITSEKGDYVVVAAESRDLGKRAGARPDPYGDRACKIIELGSDTLFFETGSSFIVAIHGENWDAKSVARAVYRESKEHTALALSIAWGNKALEWFYPQSQIDLQGISETGGRLVTGGFIGFDHNGVPSIQSQTIFYSGAQHTLSRRPDAQPPGLGQIGISGVALDLVKEFFDRKSERAVEAFGSVWRVTIAVDPHIDADLARNAIHFAMDNSTGKDKAALGGPIDVAIVRRGRMIEWISRKASCYEMDEKPKPRRKS